MRDWHLDIPLSIFATGCIICLLSILDLFSPATTQALYKIGMEIGLLGIFSGIVAVAWYE